MELEQDQIKEIIYTCLPEIIQKDIKIRDFIYMKMNIVLTTRQ